MCKIVKIDLERIKNLYFVGRNYIKHIKELKNEIPEYPLIFTKPISTISKDGNIIYPFHTQELHYEGEITFIKNGDDSFMAGCGIDYTARDIQREAIKNGKPWFLAKCFRDSTVLSKNFLLIKRENLKNLTIRTYVNGVLRQEGRYEEMIFKIDELIDYLEKFFQIDKNSLIFTGTPEGVGKVYKRDIVKVTLSSGKNSINLISEIL